MKKLLSLPFASSLTLLSYLCCPSAHAEILTEVPMQGGMVHVGITYHEHADGGMLHIHIDEGMPELLPLSHSHPNDDFDPVSPWYADLSPNTMGMAFNRQYGFVMDSASDFLPEGSTIRIRQIEASPDLKAYIYRSSGESSWEPMFGTQGSDPEFAWSLTMFHPAYAAPEGVGVLKATYEVYLVDSATGEENDHAAPVEFELSWMSGPVSGEPEVSISNPIMLSWPEMYSGYTLESTENLDHPQWTPGPSHAFVHENMYHVMVDKSKAGRFYRLVKSDTTENQTEAPMHTHLE